MERNRRKPKNDKWMMYGFYKVKETFKRSREIQLEERKCIRNYRDGRNIWLRIYLYHKNIKGETMWVMPKREKPMQIWI